MSLVLGFVFLLFCFVRFFWSVVTRRTTHLVPGRHDLNRGCVVPRIGAQGAHPQELSMRTARIFCDLKLTVGGCPTAFPHLFQYFCKEMESIHLDIGL